MADNSTPMGEGGNAGSGKKTVRGPLIPDKKGLGAHLRSGRIAAYTILGAVTIGGIGFLAIDEFHDFGGGNSVQKERIHHAPLINPGVKQQPNLSAPVSASTASVKSAVSPEPAPAAPSAPATQLPSPQMLAFQSAISGQSGQGGGVVSWGSGSSGGPVSGASSGSASPANTQALIRTLTHTLAGAQQEKRKGIYSTHLVRREVSPYELLQGTVIPAILETGIKSELSGQVTAIVDHPVYNSLNGAYVLIPAGSKLIGAYKSGAAVGQDRVGVDWTRIEFPNGTYIQLSQMPGTSPDGYAGFKDLVKNHTWEIFKNALLLSFIDVGMTMASPTSTSTNTTGVTGNQALQNGEQSLAQTFGQAETQLFQKYINIAPTITIRPGYAFNVVVTQDLVFPGAYVHRANLVGGAVPAQPAPPSIPNPYAGG